MTTTVKMKKSRDLLYVRQKGERGVYVVAFILLALYSLCMLLPLFMIFVSSFKDALEYNEQLFTGEIYKLPETFVFSNYVRAFKLMKVPVGMREVGLGEMAFHTFWMAVTAATINCITQACVGYVTAKYPSPVTRFLELATLAMMVIPLYGSSGMFMKTIQFLGLYDNWLLIPLTAFQGLGFSIFIYKGFYSGISWEYAEAIFIDGGGHLTVFFNVMIPQSFSLMLVFFIQTFLSHYGDYASKILYMPSFITIAVGLYYESMLLPRIGETPVYFAALFLSCIPIALIYIFLGKRMMVSMNIGGLKG